MLANNLRDSFRGADGDLHPPGPVKGRRLVGVGGRRRRGAAAAAVEVALQAAIGHVVVDDEPFLAGGAETSKTQQILMPYPSKYLHFHGELHLRLLRQGLQPLHRDLNDELKAGINFKILLF